MTMVMMRTKRNTHTQSKTYRSIEMGNNSIAFCLLSTYIYYAATDSIDDRWTVSYFVEPFNCYELRDIVGNNKQRFYL